MYCDLLKDSKTAGEAQKGVRKGTINWINTTTPQEVSSCPRAAHGWTSRLLSNLLGPPQCALKRHLVQLCSFHCQRGASSTTESVHFAESS